MLFNPKRVCLSCPCVSDIMQETRPSFIRQLLEIKNLGFEIALSLPYKLIPHDLAMNTAVKFAQDQECGWLFSIDDDMIIPSGAFESLFKLICSGGIEVAAGFYYQREYPHPSTWFEYDLREKRNVPFIPLSHGHYSLTTIGMGCTLIDLGWITTKCKSPFFTLQPNSQGDHVITSDVHFCKQVRESGAIICGDASVRCGHLGERMVIDDKTLELVKQLEEIGMAREATMVKQGDGSLKWQ